MLKKVNKKIENDVVTIEFIYYGNEKNQNIDYEEKDNLINKILVNPKSYNLGYIVKCIRTFYRDLDERLLVVYLYNQNLEIGAQYIDKELISYSKEVNYDSKVELNYNKDKGFKFVPDNINLDSIETFYNDLKSLKNISPVFLTGYEILLCRAYNLFYGENPDFTEKDIKVKFNIMRNILEQISYQFSCFYGERFLKFNLDERINDFYPLGKINIDNYSDGLSYTKEAEEAIKFIAESVKNSDVDMSLLSKACKTSFHQLSEERKQFVINHSDLSVTDVDACIDLVNKVKEKVYTKYFN